MFYHDISRTHKDNLIEFSVFKTIFKKKMPVFWKHFLAMIQGFSSQILGVKGVKLTTYSNFGKLRVGSVAFFFWEGFATIKASSSFFFFF